MSATAGAESSTKRPIPVRAMGFAFREAAVPRWWFFENPIPTHVSNALNLLFPDGERFFIRSVKHYMHVIEDDPELLARVRGFFGQEGRHGHEHERYNKLLQEQGYDLEPFLALYRRLAFDVLEKHVPPVLRLSATAALEHYTATMAENALKSDMLEHAHPLMRDLLRWHAAEEIEHKSVAYDVLQRVDPRWSVRAAGLAIGTASILAFWILGARELLRQEAAMGTELDVHRRAAAADPVLERERRHRAVMFRAAIADYLRADFHPDQKNDYELARAYLDGIGRLAG
ncbi:metal-dependent hydrolase [Sandaracinus amylolyticus]|uniref:Metal-dependent hydrolase n=1 Tax=Sandaracinus amylolyticus TaxID=927083 RepID=A0A0F6YHP3_9BACT|nr:metal-dependent hydrolase [Sandaracinus amylolyticus]AKF04932.1 hypothetical protein DB32_002081 [Sandaracinus amylolyticus]